MSRRFLPSLAVLAVVTAAPLLAQVQDRGCGTMDHLNELVQQDPKLPDRMAQIEAFTQAWIAQNGGSTPDVVHTIPVVVHVVWNTAAENLSDALIQTQIQVLTEDFRRLNPDAGQTRAAFLPVAADSEFNFCLATRDPSGNPTNGITRTQTATTSFSSNNNVKFTANGGRDAWPAASYLNIWVCDLGGGLLGYAQFPGGAASTDGVVCDYAYFGRPATVPFHLGRTATHEVGHWLNLRHIWGDSSTCGVDDLVADTPDSNAATNSCPTGTITQCGVSIQWENYMDYTYDACMNMFTQGQKTRMKALFNPGGARFSLLSSLGCGPVTPQYQVNQTHSGLDIDGVQGSSGAAAIVSKCPNAAGTVHLLSAVSNIGLPHDTALSFVPLVPASTGGVTLADGQIVNVNLAQPLFFLSTGSTMAALPPWPGNQTIPFTAITGGNFTLQKIQVTPSVPIGFALSQGSRLEVTTGGTFPAGPTADDSSVTLSLGTTCLGSLTFYGAVRTQAHIASNGRVNFHAADSDFSPTLAEALSDTFAGFWTDLDPSAGGSITIGSPGANLLRVTYAAVPYYGTTTGVSFAVEFNTSTNTVTLDNLAAIPANPAASTTGTTQFLGISRGTGAVDSGATAFAPGGAGTPANLNSMLYSFYNNTGGGLAGALTGPLNRIVFTPSGAGYSWVGL